jgi:hypothetical protein
MKELPFGHYWVGQVVEEDIEKLPKKWDAESLRIKGNGGMAHCTKDDWAPWKYFLGVIHRRDYFRVGGMDEEFMKGIAWEDRDFALRVQRTLVCHFRPEIVGIHITHPRSYQHNAPELRMRNRRLYYAKAGKGS